MAGESRRVAGIVDQLVDEVDVERRSAVDNAEQQPLVEGYDVEAQQSPQGAEGKPRSMNSVWMKDLVHCFPPLFGQYNDAPPSEPLAGQMP